MFAEPPPQPGRPTIASFGRTSRAISAVGLADRTDIGNDGWSERKDGTGALPDMDIIENLVSAADPSGLAMYVAVMAVFLGSVALARLRDDVMDSQQHADDDELPHRVR
jgi:hypothetical protein